MDYQCASFAFIEQNLKILKDDCKNILTITELRIGDLGADGPSTLNILCIFKNSLERLHLCPYSIVWISSITRITLSKTLKSEHR